VAFSLLGEVTSLIIYILTTVGLTGLFALMIVESFGIPPIPSEVILPFTGFLVAEGIFTFPAAVIVAVAGALCGAFAAYAVGRWWRHRITGLGVGHLRISSSQLDRVDGYFARHGEVTVALCRLIPVIRAYISYPAGSARMDSAKFGAFTLIGSVPYAIALIYAGELLRSDWPVVSSYFAYLNYPLLVLIAAAAVYIVLEVAGVLPPGWPPHRRRPDSAPTPATGGPPRIPPTD
jgi:membrane protein DedA with SNARE-associated domain